MLQCMLVYKSSGRHRHGLLLHTCLGVDCSVRVTGEKTLSGFQAAGHPQSHQQCPGIWLFHILPAHLCFSHFGGSLVMPHRGFHHIFLVNNYMEHFQMVLSELLGNVLGGLEQHKFIILHFYEIKSPTWAKVKVLRGQYPSEAGEENPVPCRFQHFQTLHFLSVLLPPLSQQWRTEPLFSTSLRSPISSGYSFHCEGSL